MLHTSNELLGTDVGMYGCSLGVLQRKAYIYRAIQLNEDTFLKIVYFLLKSYTMHELLIYHIKLSKFLVLNYKGFFKFYRQKMGFLEERERLNICKKN